MSFSVNNGTKYYSTTDFNTSGRVSILYQAETNKFELGNIVIDCPSKFVSDKVLLSIRVKDNSAASEFDVFEINGQQLNTAPKDNGNPYISCDSSEKGNRRYGDLITILPAIDTSDYTREDWKALPALTQQIVGTALYSHRGKNYDEEKIS